MSTPLFRKEALEHRKDRLFGEVILLQPLSITVLVGIVAFICTLIVAILLWGTYARKETVQGYLLPDKGIVKAYTPQPGTITKVFVREGDAVKENQPLIAILSERSLQNGKNMDTVLLQELEATKLHQEERIKGEKALFSSETIRLQGQINGLKKELDQIEESLRTQEDRLSILESRVKGAKKLYDNKNLSEHDYQKLYEELLVQKQQYQELLRRKLSSENTFAQAKTELEQLPIKSTARIADIENAISELKQRHAEIEGRHALEIRAPIAGTITALQVKEGQWQANNMPLLAIMPHDAFLQVELFVPSRAIGFVAPHQTVRIRYHAFPYQRFGIYEGEIAFVSKHVLLPSELPVPLELKEPVYRVTVNLKQQHVNAYGKDFPLQAGMSLEADIILDKQTLFQWIFNPLISLKGRG